MDMEKDASTMEKIVALCKRRGFVFQGSEIYGGLKGTWDLGPLGVLLNNHIKREWWKHFVESREDMYGLDAAILMNAMTWKASGHVDTFYDPLVEDTKTGERYRADHLIKAFIEVLRDKNIHYNQVGNAHTPESTLSTLLEIVNEQGLSKVEVINEIVSKYELKSPKGNPLSPARQFNMMLETHVGPIITDDNLTYLRPETAQGIFVNFKNVLDTMSPKLPFGIAQIGKAFRNEIAPRDFLFRVREFEQMEIEYFVKEAEWQERFEQLLSDIRAWHTHLGLASENVREYEVPENDLAHYSKRTIDFEYNYPGKGFDELAGFAYRTDHDLKSHQTASGVSMEYLEPDGTRFIPHVLEPSFGVGRALTAVLCEAYTEDEMNGEVRVVLKLPKHLAPYRVAVSPLLKNKPELVAKAREVFTLLKKEFGNVAWDDNSNVGKRYRRQDEIGTPYCVTIDFDTLGENPSLLDTVTVRDRDTGEQERVAIATLVNTVK